MHSAAWDSSYDLSGKTIAVLGGCPSDVQIIPNIQLGESSRVNNRLNEEGVS
jgi:cation diffusion facilitator CzcD-associated flavoprotein CzcO